MFGCSLSIAGFLLIFAGESAHAGEEPSEVDGSQEAAKAEYVRLTQDIEKLASRNAWAGVERTYLAILDTGVSPSFTDHVAGAQSSRVVGDTALTHQRLSAATELQEDSDVMDWLWEIDSNYGKVYLVCDLNPKAPLVLSAGAMPFDPAMASSVRHAVSQVTGSCLFDGFLPKGTYTFGTKEFAVVPRVQSVRLDFRNLGGSKRSRKPKK
jgi:hypothetical protein